MLDYFCYLILELFTFSFLLFSGVIILFLSYKLFDYLDDKFDKE